MEVNRTHDVAARSWLASANASAADFPLQNLPFGVFRRAGSSESFRGGVAIGDQIVDVTALCQTPLLTGLALEAGKACAQPSLNAFMAMGPAAWSALRHGLFDLLAHTAPPATQQAVGACLLPQSTAEHAVPTRIGDYTDFYTSIDHARNVGVMVRPDAPVGPNFQWIPIAYHGRSSSIGVGSAGQPQKFPRPKGQSMAPGATTPVFGPCARLDYELELAIWIGQGNAQGTSIPLAQAEDHIFGFGLLNDWSARDIQFWEMAPLGPFLGKNFCTTVSPWIVTHEAMAPYRLPFTRPADHPQPLAYLAGARNTSHGCLDIELEVCIESQHMRDKGLSAARVSQTNFKHQYWTVGQMVTQHTNGGCNLNPGDLFGSGTISGPTPAEGGAMIELTKGGREPLTLSTTGEQRSFLQDCDAVILRGRCARAGFASIGFGESRGIVLPSV